MQKIGMPLIGTTTKRKTRKMENQEPTVNKEGHMLPPLEETKLSPKEEQAIELLSKTIDIENAPKNSVLIVKIGTDDPMYANNLQMGVIQRILNPRVDILKEKRLTVLFMAREDDIALLTEEDMEKAGWVKKEPSRIIVP